MTSRLCDLIARTTTGSVVAEAAGMIRPTQPMFVAASGGIKPNNFCWQINELLGGIPEVARAATISTH